jgi:hypothetical protein
MGAMLLLTWHGTILRLEKDSARLSHAGLVPQREMAADLSIALPAEGLIAPLKGPAGITLLPGPLPGTAHLAQNGRYLRVGDAAYPLFVSTEAGDAETFSLVTPEDIALLRDLLSHGWIRTDTGEALPPSAFAVTPGPALQAGGMRLELGRAWPAADPQSPDTVFLPLADMPVVLRRAPGSRLSHREIAIVPQDPARVPPVADEAAFRARCPARLTRAAPPEFGLPPILGRLADRDFVYRRGMMGLAPRSGRQALHSEVVRERNKLVLLDHGLEGMILDAAGVSTEIGQLVRLAGPPPPPLAREGGRFFLDAAWLEAAPFLPGPHAVFYDDGCRDHYGWLIDSLVPLTVLAPLLPPGAALLLPAGLARPGGENARGFDPMGLLEAFGFGAMPRVPAPGGVCRVEDVYWPARRGVGQLPATALRAARERALAHRPAPRGPRRRLYVRQDGGRPIANAEELEKLLTRNGFTPVTMADFTAAEQIDMFRQAEMVVGAHGAALANLLFCPAGAQVLELSPECEYRPAFNAIAAKLGLAHAVLPCPTRDGTFEGTLTVPLPRLHLLLSLLLSRQAA